MAGNTTAVRKPDTGKTEASSVIRIGGFASVRAAEAFRRGAEGKATGASQPVAADEGDDAELYVDDLKSGTELLRGQYVINGFLNSGGFGITYLARDSLDRTVVIKECFPGAFCRRSDTFVRPRSRGQHAEFRAVVRLFMQEARNLAKLSHPNIVGVHQVFEDNDTAYMAIDYIDGRDLLEIIEDERADLTPDEIVALLKKLLDAVGFVHKRGMLHRDISPDNILIDMKGNPVLIDFGAAREQAAKTSRMLSALRVVKDGYSPQEFYVVGSNQGPSSDLYALAATFYHLIAGEAPPDSQRRLAAVAEEAGDPYQRLAGRFPGYPPGFLEALDKAASVLPRDRIGSAGEWLAMIEQGQRAPAPLAEAVPPVPKAALVRAKTEPAALPPRSVAASAVLGAVIVAMVGLGYVLIGPVLAARAPAVVQDVPVPEAASVAAAPVAAVPLVEVSMTEARHGAGVAARALAAATVGGAPQPAPLRNQVISARWDLNLPFETRLAKVGSKLVPVVAQVLPAAAGLAANDWLAEGVGIYEVNEIPVLDRAAIERIVFDLPDAGGAGLVLANLTVREDGVGPFEHVSLAVPGTRWITLRNGAVLRSSRVGGAWQVAVESMTAEEAGGFAPGDILLSERWTGDRLAGPRGLEELLARLARAGATEAVFEVSRAGLPAEVRLALAGQ
jgi:hypothetical protein